MVPSGALPAVASQPDIESENQLGEVRTRFFRWAWPELDLSFMFAAKLKQDECSTWRSHSIPPPVKARPLHT
jgi:hypothetical protein